VGIRLERPTQVDQVLVGDMQVLNLFGHVHLLRPFGTSNSSETR
jgi:hypothetical protein